MHAKNSPIVFQAPEHAREKIEQEVAAGRMAGPFDHPPTSPFHVSPISLRPKKNGGYRLIHNLSYPYDENSINSYIQDGEKRVKYATIGDAIKKIYLLT